LSFDGSGGVDDASETAGNHAVEGANGVVCVAHVVDSGIGVAYGRDNGVSFDGSGSVDALLRLWKTTQLKVRI